MGLSISVYQRNTYYYDVIEQYSDIIYLLYVAGEFQHTYVYVYAISIILLVMLPVLLADNYVANTKIHKIC